MSRCVQLVLLLCFVSLFSFILHVFANGKCFHGRFRFFGRHPPHPPPTPIYGILVIKPKISKMAGTSLFSRFFDSFSRLIFLIEYTVTFLLCVMSGYGVEVVPLASRSVGLSSVVAITGWISNLADSLKHNE